MTENVGRTRRQLRTFAVFAFVLALLSGGSTWAQSEFETTGRIVAVGDIHGGFNQFVSLLRTAGLIDGRNQWKGGDSHLVQTGDVVDRGADSRKVLDLLMDLERQAPKAGGMVHALLGNHETMNMLGDLRYVDRGEYDAFRTPESRALRDHNYEQLADPAKKDDGKYRSKWEDEHPLGWVEHRLAFGKTGKYGRWLREKNAVVKINKALFMHGGISPKYAALSLQEINDRIRAELQDFSKINGGLVTDPEGPLWYRGLSEQTGPEMAAHVDSVLARFGASHIVVAHSPTPGIVLPRFGGKVILIDVGISKVYGEGRACLVFDGAKPFALHRGTRLPLPSGDDVGAFMEYLKAAEFLEPANSHLHEFVRTAGRAPATTSK